MNLSITVKDIGVAESFANREIDGNNVLRSDHTEEASALCSSYIPNAPQANSSAGNNSPTNISSTTSSSSTSHANPTPANPEIRNKRVSTSRTTSHMMELEKDTLHLSQMELRRDQRYLGAMIDLKKEHYRTIEKLMSVFVNAYCSYVEYKTGKRLREDGRFANTTEMSESESENGNNNISLNHHSAEQ